MRRYGPWLAALLWCGALHAEPSTTTAAARSHFESGLAAVERGELEAALASFQAAYGLQPHYSVLFNIGQAHAALGRPVEAVATFERFLNEGGARLNTERREEAQALLSANQRRTGQLQFNVIVPGTRVWLDGKLLSPDALKRPIALAVGRHVVLYAHADGAPTTTEVDIESSTLAMLRLESHKAPPAESGWLRIVCPVPSVTVEIDGVAAALTPVTEPLVAATGVRTVRFHRVGFREVAKQVVAWPQRSTTVSCDQWFDSNIAPAHQARLTVRPTPSDAEVFLNGHHHIGGAVPIGPHELTVLRDGFEPHRQRVVLTAERDTTLEVELRSTRAQQARHANAKRQRRTLGVVLAGSGLGLASTSAALLAWNSNRYEDWHRNATPTDVSQVASIQRADDLALGTSILAGALLLSGAWYLLTNEPMAP